ncbi:MAG: hypothetical protein J6125_02955 [Clostridia bacterium]|nr:hypothetical protein [Clostridia bacterium]
MFRAKQTLSPAACFAVGMLTTIGAVSIWSAARRMICRSGSQIKRFGHECADAVDEGVDRVRDCECCDNN